MNLTCADCLFDLEMLKLWEKQGGLLPARTCTEEHLERCKSCKRYYEEINEDGRCDECWLKREHRERPLPGQEPKKRKKAKAS